MGRTLSIAVRQCFNRVRQTGLLHDCNSEVFGGLWRSVVTHLCGGISMSLSNIFSGMQVSASGLSAERMRMEVVANNIANAHSTGDKPGMAYRRQRVNFASEMDQFMDPGATGMKGVKILGVSEDPTPLETIYDPGNAAADENGMVEIPNVQIPIEMVDLVTASRAYEANLKSLQTYKQLAEQTLSLLRGIS